MARVLLIFATLFAWSSIFTPIANLTNPVPFASISLLALIAIANVYEPPQRKHNLLVSVLLVVALLLTTAFFGVFLVGDILNSFSIYGVDMTISIVSLLGATGWVIRQSHSSGAQPPSTSQIVVVVR